MRKHNSRIRQSLLRFSQKRKTRRNNNLWQARKRRGLRIKQVAFLLGNKSIESISRYERGHRIPSLKTALKLELILGVPVKGLFPDLTAHVAGQLRDQVMAGKRTRIRHAELRKKLTQDVEFCTYSETLSRQIPALTYRERIRKHITDITRKLASL